MQRVPMGRSCLNPRLANNFLDTCAFDPKYSPEHEAAQKIRILGNTREVVLALAHSNQREIDHPNTPVDVKTAAKNMIFTNPTGLTQAEQTRKELAQAILTGNGHAQKYAADAAHVFEAGKYGGYFITTDERILNKRVELKIATNANILRPSEWLKLFHDNASV
ncbi:hypothetical protein [Fluviicoccus keumensis]|uniref:hypothetical protein n=1 Tax=Fluviicoccus keumensis TaxID=1435465 RepID=UPI00102CE2AB|nr:hypothetical protein [Fluviicoccus keumensis]